jgi:hypothetical protein
MPNDVLHDLQAAGHLTRVTRLARLGHGRRAIERAIADGRLHRISRDWVGTPAASRSAIIAVLHRGKLTGSSALASYGIWDGLDRRIHVHVPRNSHGPVREPHTPISRFAAEEFPHEGVVRHWLDERYPDRAGYGWRVSVLDALIRVAHDVPAEQFVACAESALHLGLLSGAGLPMLFAALPRRLRDLYRLVVPLAESGLETIARLRLGRFVGDIRAQVWIDGIGPGGRRGRVDLLLEGWLVIELDGDDYHHPVRDRHRDAALVRRGYRIHRFGYDQVIHRWPEVEETVRELLCYLPVRA